MHYSDIGRPTLDVSMDEVGQLRILGFSWITIAEMLNISRRTLYRRLDGSGIIGYTDIIPQELDAVILAYKRNHPNDGEVMTIGFLRSCQIHVPRAEIRSSIHRVDSAGVSARRSTTIQRRVYTVEAPNSVWHVDGNHKLIRWKLVVHGAIDGYSRMIPFLYCSMNNRAETVYRLFQNAISIFGLPKRVRTDGGGENVDVWAHMSQHRANSRSVIVGSSVHNVRIERLWRDVRRAVVDVYREIFARLEREQVLDPDNDVDLFCLHEVFIPRINRSLREFVSSWHNHPISTERNMTPLQLFHIGLLEVDEDSNDGDQSPLPTVSDHVQIHNLHYTPCTTLKSNVNHALQQNEHREGYDVYRLVSNIVGQHLLNNCTSCVYV